MAVRQTSRRPPIAKLMTLLLLLVITVTVGNCGKVVTVSPDSPPAASTSCVLDQSKIDGCTL